ncbi:hypothetical protein A2U01_0072418, partial [Trifolium medium]|nr:hypothetical protein [Trifolium medium]
PAKERISPSDAQSETKKNPEDEYMEDDLLNSEPELDIICNVVSVLPREYDVWSMSDREQEFYEPPLADFKPVCYYIMNNGCVEEQQATFERPDEGMKNH